MTEPIGPTRGDDGGDDGEKGAECPDRLATTEIAPIDSETLTIVQELPTATTALSDVAARMDQFIWQRREAASTSESAGVDAQALPKTIRSSPEQFLQSPSDDATAEDVIQQIDRLLEDTAALPRIVTAPSPEAATGPSLREETWRRQFLSALRGVDHSGPRAPVPHVQISSERDRTSIDVPAAEPKRDMLPSLYSASARADEPRTTNLSRLVNACVVASRILAPHRHIVLATGTVIAITGVMSAAIPQIATLSMAPASVAPDVASSLQAMEQSEIPKQTMLNTPVLVREGAAPSGVIEALSFAPSFATTRRVQSIVVREPARVLAPHSAEAGAVAVDGAARAASPTQMTSDAMSVPPLTTKTSAPAMTPLPLDRAGLRELAVQTPPSPTDTPTEPPAAAATPKKSDVDKPRETSTQSPSVDHQASGATHASPSKPPRRKTAKRVRTTKRQWDTPRQGLRTAATQPEPEPEPSPLKKLFNALTPTSLWPSSTTEPASKPQAHAQPKKSEPATSSTPLYSWRNPDHPTP